MTGSSAWTNHVDVELAKEGPTRSEFLVFAPDEIFTPILIQHLKGDAFYVFANGAERFLSGPGAAIYIVARGDIRVFLDPYNAGVSKATARITLGSPMTGHREHADTLPK